jgi:hypothetical protein
LVDLGRWVDDSRGLMHKVYSSSWSRRSRVRLWINSVRRCTMRFLRIGTRSSWSF